jgi:hypothetical protein
MIDVIRDEAVRRRISRLCHFTPSRNVIHILSGVEGILGTQHLNSVERSVFTQNDLLRLDGHAECISCSIEYPNAWYFAKTNARDAIFKDWVVLLIDPKYLWMEGTLFCPRNAGAGRNILSGERGFRGLFADSVPGAGGRVFTRASTRAPCCPTDEQAEVLVPDRIAIDDLKGLVVHDEAQAKNELVRFELAGVPKDLMARLKFIIAPTFFDKWALHECLESGKRPVETEWEQGG